MGYRIYIDDFGVGYSNISSVLNMNIDGIKIDRSITTATEYIDTIRALSGLAKTRNLSIVAEGIETEFQAEALKSLDKQFYAQGWLYGKPMPIDELIKLVA